MGKKNIEQRLSVDELESELRRERYRSRYNSVLRSTIYTLITVAAAAVLVATLWLPVLKIYGNSMTPTLNDGDIIFSVKTSEMRKGDVVAFYYNNKILVKRVIAGPGDWVDIDKAGNVSVNGTQLDEPYVSEKALGATNIDLPYQVPDGKFFVIGDHRETSVDSRNTAVGCISQEQMVGRLVFRMLPFDEIGSLS